MHVIELYWIETFGKVFYSDIEDIEEKQPSISSFFSIGIAIPNMTNDTSKLQFILIVSENTNNGSPCPVLRQLLQQERYLTDCPCKHTTCICRAIVSHVYFFSYFKCHVTIFSHTWLDCGTESFLCPNHQVR